MQRGRRRQLLVCGGIGVLIGVGTSVADIGTLASAGIVVVACVAVTLFGLRFMLPRRAHKTMLDWLDPDAGPPADTVPVSLDLASRWAGCSGRYDVAGIKELFAEDFVYRYPKLDTDLSGSRYGWGLRLSSFGFKSADMTVDEVSSSPDTPHLYWVRFTQVCRPHHGPVLDSTWWEKWTVDPDLERIREAELVGIIRVG